MMQEKIKTYQVLDNQYCYNGFSSKETNHNKDKFSISNLVSLITTQIVQEIPGVNLLTDTKFISFQEHLTRIIQKEIKKLDKES